MLIVLPSHLRVSGVTTWAMRAVEQLRSRSIEAGILVHTHPDQAVPAFLEPFVSARIQTDRPIEALNGRIESLIPQYRCAVEEMYEKTAKPVVVAPCLHGDCFGAVAALTQSIPEKLRMVSWLHSDNGYDLAVSAHYESVCHGFVGVSRELCELARDRLPARGPDVVHMPHSISPPGALSREPYTGSRPIRAVYTGRIDEHQKRVSALPWIARSLHAHGVDFELRVVGNGDAMDTLRSDTASIPEVTLVGAVPPDEVGEHLRWAEVWVLPSRFEGQSIAMMEAMAHGCVPVVAKVRSGATDAIEHRQSGMIVEGDADTDAETIGTGMGDAIGELCSMDLSSMSRRAVDTIVRTHSPAVHAKALLSLISKAQSMPARQWGTNRAVAFTGGESGGGSGSTPADGAARLGVLLETLSGQRVALYGAGRHTIDLAGVLASSPAQIVCVIDDDPSSSTLLGWPVISFDDLDRFGISDIVISSWIHEDQMHARCAQRAPGINAHRLYSAPACCPSDG